MRQTQTQHAQVRVACSPKDLPDAAAQMAFVPVVNVVNGFVAAFGEEYGLADFGDCFAAMAANGFADLYAANPETFDGAASVVLLSSV